MHTLERKQFFLKWEVAQLISFNYSSIKKTKLFSFSKKSLH